MSLIIDWLFPKKCFGCKKGKKYLCSKCEGESGGLKRIKGFEGVISIFRYHGAVRKLIEAIKYEFISDAIDEIASLMVKKLKTEYPNIIKYWQEEKFTIVPVPLAKRRQNWRGFNQSEKISEIIAQKLELNYNSQAIIRTKIAKTQAKIKKGQLRKKNVEGVFELKEKIEGGIIVVDDVVTSGSTLQAIQKILRKDSSQCWGLTLAGAGK